MVVGFGVDDDAYVVGFGVGMFDVANVAALFWPYWYIPDRYLYSLFLSTRVESMRGENAELLPVMEMKARLIRTVYISKKKKGVPACDPIRI